VLRVICSDAELLRFLYETYDANGTTAVVRDLVVVLARHVHSALQLTGEGMEEILNHMALLFSQKAKGIEWSPDMEMLVMGGIHQEAFAVALALDGLLCLIESVRAQAGPMALLARVRLAPGRGNYPNRSIRNRSGG